jgi:hypothetical protein
MLPYLPTSFAKWNKYSFASIAKVGVIQNGTEISIGSISGYFSILKSSRNRKKNLYFIEVDSAEVPLGTFLDFIAFAKNKEKDQVTADDYLDLNISGTSWRNFRTTYIKRSISVMAAI